MIWTVKPVEKRTKERYNKWNPVSRQGSIFSQENMPMVMIEIENIKKFMAGFLGGNLFDDFLMSEGKLSMNISYEFDGKILKEFYDTEEWKEMKQYPYVTWEEEKEKIFSLVKGKEDTAVFSICDDVKTRSFSRVSCQI